MTSTEAMFYQLKQLKGKPLKQKLEHIVTYFWLPILVTLAILIGLVSYIVHLATLKEDALNVFCINAVSSSAKQEALVQDFAQTAGIDLDDYNIFLSTAISISGDYAYSSFEAVQALAARVTAGSVDVMTADIATMQRYFYQDYFYDLREVLTAQQQEAYSEYYLYADLALAAEIYASGELPDSFPDPTKPELMEQPAPVAIRVPEDSVLIQKCYPKDETVGIALLGNAKHLDNGLAFLDYIFNKG